MLPIWWNLCEDFFHSLKHIDAHNYCKSQSGGLPLQLYLQKGRWSLCLGGRWAAVWSLDLWRRWCWTSRPLLTCWHRNRSNVSPLQTDEHRNRHTGFQHAQYQFWCFFVLFFWYLFFFFFSALIWKSSLNPHHFVRVLVCDVGVVGPWCQRACVADGDGLCIELIQEGFRLVFHTCPNRSNAAEEQQRWNDVSRHDGCFRPTEMDGDCTLILLSLQPLAVPPWPLDSTAIIKGVSKLLLQIGCLTAS